LSRSALTDWLPTGSDEQALTRPVTLNHDADHPAVRYALVQPLLEGIKLNNRSVRQTSKDFFAISSELSQFPPGNPVCYATECGLPGRHILRSAQHSDLVTGVESASHELRFCPPGLRRIHDEER